MPMREAGTAVEMAPVRDRDLIERCSRGDQGAWSELFRRYDPVVTRATRGVRGVEVADVRQEVWARLVEKGAPAGLRLERPGSLRAFFARVAVRVALDHRRRCRASNSEEPIDAETAAGPSDDPEAAAIRAEELRTVALGLCRLAANERNARILRLYLRDGLGPAEIAASGVGLSAKGVASLLRRACSSLGAGTAKGRSPGGSPPRHAAGIRPRTP
jgi:RNA polymerase sigma-70 factor, ECF subfamily